MCLSGTLLAFSGNSVTCAVEDGADVDSSGMAFAFSAAAAKELFVGDKDEEAEDEDPADHDLIVLQCNTGRTSRQNCG